MDIKEVFESFLKKDYVKAEEGLKEIFEQKKKEYLKEKLQLEDDDCDCDDKDKKEHHEDDEDKDGE